MATKKATRKSATKKAGKGATKKASKKSAAKSHEFGIADLLRNPILASLGAISLTQEGIERLVKDLIDRGETSEREGRKIVEDYQKRTRKSRKDMQEAIDDSIANALKTFRLPSKKDVDELEKKINTLSRKVDRLLKQQGHA